MERRFDGRGLRVGRVLARNDRYTRHHVTFESGRFTVSGILNIPRARGRHPLLVLAHGYIDPDVYVNGQGMRREQDYLARRGYAVLHVDYRNHAQSDDDPNNELHIRLGYVEDVINAVLAARAARLPSIDAERAAVVGRSMGGAVSLGAAVVRPDLMDAIVVFASVSSDAGDNFNKWIRRAPDRRAVAHRIEQTYGTPEDAPAFWRGVSPRTHFDRIAAPVLMHHGTDDETCPIAWSRETLRELRRHGKDATLLEYEGEHHAFGPQWPLSMRRTVTFLDRTVKARA